MITVAKAQGRITVAKFTRPDGSMDILRDGNIVGVTYRTEPIWGKPYWTAALDEDWPYNHYYNGKTMAEAVRAAVRAQGWKDKIEVER